jgi:hypothetical protein
MVIVRYHTGQPSVEDEECVVNQLFHISIASKTFSLNHPFNLRLCRDKQLGEKWLQRILGNEHGRFRNAPQDRAGELQQSIQVERPYKIRACGGIKDAGMFVVLARDQEEDGDPPEQFVAAMGPRDRCLIGHRIKNNDRRLGIIYR